MFFGVKATLTILRISVCRGASGPNVASGAPPASSPSSVPTRVPSAPASSTRMPTDGWRAPDSSRDRWALEMPVDADS